MTLTLGLAFITEGGGGMRLEADGFVEGGGGTGWLWEMPGLVVKSYGSSSKPLPSPPRQPI